MPIYFCGICKYTTESKSSMDRHKSRKTPCKENVKNPEPAARILLEGSGPDATAARVIHYFVKQNIL